jgi:biopolymer transport protein ExbD
MAAHSSGHPSLITRINVVPIIDVALVLVIILLVTAPIITVSELPVNLPAAHSRGAEDERNLSITLGPNGELAIDRETVSRSDFSEVLRARLAEPENEDVLVVVRADTGAPYTRVGDILEEARSAGATRLAIATRQEASGRTHPRSAVPVHAGAGQTAPRPEPGSEAGR